MSVTPREDHVVDDVVVGARRVRTVVDSVSRSAGPVRLLIAGPRGSAKSAVLRHLADTLSGMDRAVAWLARGDDPAAAPVGTVLIVDDLHLLDTAILDALERRLADPAASVVAATGPWSRTPAVARIARVLESARPPLVLGQVSRADVLDHRDGLDALDASCLDWVLRATGGVSWLVAAALTAHDSRDCDGDPAHLELERLLAGVIAHRLAAVDEDVRLTVEHASADLAAGSSADALRHAYAEGLLLRDGRPAPVVRAAVATGMSPQGLVDRAVGAYAVGDLDAASFLVDLAQSRPGEESTGLLSAVAAATWAARGMLEIAHRQYIDADAPDAAGADIAAVGVGIVPGPGGRADRTSDLTSTGRIASGLLRDGLRLSLQSDSPDAAVATLARASQLYTASRSTTPLPELPAVIAAAAAQSCGDLATARLVVDAALAGGQGDRGAAPRLLLWRAWLAMHQVRSGEAREALAAATAAVATFTPRDELLAHAVRLGLARRYGDAAALGSAWESAKPTLLSIDVDLYLLQPLTEFVGASAKLHDTDATDAVTAQALGLLGRLDEPALWANPLRWASVQRGILVNDPDSIAPHAHALAAASEASSVATTMASVGRLWTAVLGGTIDADDIEVAATSLAGLGFTWDAARLSGSAAALADDRRVAARLLSRAREIHPPDAARSSSRPPEGLSAVDAEAADPGSTSGLSRREVDVARLVIEGKTYAEIGAAIFISPRTAEHHIASIRRRLGATSRSDLIAKLRVALSSAADARAVA